MNKKWAFRTAAVAAVVVVLLTSVMPAAAQEGTPPAGWWDAYVRGQTATPTPTAVHTPVPTRFPTPTRPTPGLSAPWPTPAPEPTNTATRTGTATDTPTYTPAATQTQTPTGTATPACTVIHVVQSGETLSNIALRYDVTVSAITDANGLTDQNFVWVGQRLCIPGARPSKPSQEAPPPPTSTRTASQEAAAQSTPTATDTPTANANTDSNIIVPVGGAVSAGAQALPWILPSKAGAGAAEAAAAGAGLELGLAGVAAWHGVTGKTQEMLEGPSTLEQHWNLVDAKATVVALDNTEVLEQGKTAAQELAEEEWCEALKKNAGYLAWQVSYLYQTLYHITGTASQTNAIPKGSCGWNTTFTIVFNVLDKTKISKAKQHRSWVTILVQEKALCRVTIKVQ